MAIFAKGIDRVSNYDYRQWEYMEGTDDLTADEAAEFIRECMKDDKKFHHRQVTEYEYREMTFSQLLDAGHIKDFVDTQY